MVCHQALWGQADRLMGADTAVAKGRDVFTIRPAHAALLVIDMQNAFLAEGAAFEAPNGREIIPNIERLVRFARRHGAPVIWVLADHSPPYGGAVLAKSPAVRDERVCWPGDESFQLYPNMIQPDDGDYRVVKHKYDSFFETDLNAILRNLNIRTVIVTGVTTSVCCDSTARAAFHYDYDVAFLSDATADEFDDLHVATLRVMDLLFGRVMTTGEAIAEMEENLHAVPAAGHGPE